MLIWTAPGSGLHVSTARRLLQVKVHGSVAGFPALHKVGILRKLVLFRIPTIRDYRLRPGPRFCTTRSLRLQAIRLRLRADIQQFCAYRPSIWQVGMPALTIGVCVAGLSGRSRETELKAVRLTVETRKLEHDSPCSEPQKEQEGKPSKIILHPC